MILIFKTSAGVALAISRHDIKLVYFTDVTSRRLRVDANATAGGEQDGIAQGRRMVLICKANMHPGSILNPEQCTAKVDRNAMKRWLSATLQQMDQHQATASPPHEHEHDEEMQEQQQPPPQQQGELPPNGSGTATPVQTPTQHELNGGRAPAVQDKQVPTRFSFANPDPPRTTWETIGTRGNRANNAPVAPVTGHRSSRS